MDKRKFLFKKAIDGDSCRRRREEQQVQIRKQKREESLSQRRRMDTTSAHTPAAAGSFGPYVGIGVAGAGANGVPPSLQDLPMYALDMRSGDAARELEATRAVRKLLSVQRNPPVEQILAHGFVPMLVGQLTRENASSILLFEASWALTNVGSTNYTRALVDAGAIPPLTRLLLHPCPDVREQCAWAMGNISGDCPELRDHVLTHGALPPLLQNLLSPACLSMSRNCTWALSNLCRGKPQPHLKLLRPALPVLARILASCTDSECLQDAGWALSYLCDGDAKRIDAVIETPGVCADLVRHLTHENAGVLTPVVRTLGNIVSGDDNHTQAVIDAGALLYMPSLLKNSKKNIRKEIMWLLSNIAAGNREQVHALAMTKGLISMVLMQMATAEWEVVKEAIWVVANFATGGNAQHVQLLVELGALKTLCDLLEAGDSKVVDITLDAVEAILKQGSTASAAASAAAAGAVGGGGYLQLFYEADGPERLAKLQEHASDKIYHRAVRMIEQYVGLEEEEEEEGGGREGGVERGGFGFEATGPVGVGRGEFCFSNLGH